MATDFAQRLGDTYESVINKHNDIKSQKFADIDVDGVNNLLSSSGDTLKDVQEYLKEIADKLSPVTGALEDLRKWIEQALKDNPLVILTIKNYKYKDNEREALRRAQELRKNLGNITKKIADLEKFSTELDAKANELADDAWWGGEEAKKVLAALDEHTKEQERLAEEKRKKEEEEEKERERQEKEKKEIEEKEEEERKKKEEEERKRKGKEEQEQLDAEERLQKEKEERERLQTEQEKLKEEAEQKKREEQELQRQAGERRKREMEEKRQREEEARKRKDPSSWPVWVYDVSGGDLNIPVGCVVRAFPGPLQKESLTVKLIDRTDHSFIIDETDELVSQIISITYTDPEQEHKLEEPLAVAIPHVAPRNVPTREPVVKKKAGDGVPWAAQDSKEVSFPDMREYRFSECRLSEPGCLAVAFRSRVEKQTVGSSGGKLTSSVDMKINLNVPANLYRSKVNLCIQVNQVDPLAITTSRQDGTDNFLACSPIVNLTLPPQELDKPIHVTVPVPGPPEHLTQRPSTAFKSDSSQGELHLMKCSNQGRWQEQTHIPVTEETRTGTSSFKTTDLLKKFAVLRCKKGTSAELLQLFMAGLDRAMRKKKAQVILRQNEADPSKVALLCVNPAKTDECLNSLKEEGYTKGPRLEQPISMDEGQLLRVGFTGNIDGESTKALALAYNTHMKSRLDMLVKEKDPYLQKGIEWYRGYLQTFIEDRGAAQGSSTSGTKTPLSEHLITLPRKDLPMQRQKSIVVYRQHDAVNEELLREVAPLIGDQWDYVARALGMRQPRINTIRRNNDVDNSDDAAFEMLMTWIKGLKRSDPKVSLLCRALLQANQHTAEHVVRQREAQFQEGKSVQASVK